MQQADSAYGSGKPDGQDDTGGSRPDSATPITELLKGRYQHFGVEMLSGVPLNSTSGGLNPYAVDHGLKLGARLLGIGEQK